LPEQKIASSIDVQEFHLLTYFTPLHIKLTDAEKQAVQQGKPVEFREDGVDCVVLRADLFERYRRQMSETLAPEVVTQLVDKAMADVDAGDPLLDSYQKHRR
jgi:hypothetical protein